MNPISIQTIVSLLGSVLALGGIGGVAWALGNELRLRAVRRGRMQLAGPQTSAGRQPEQRPGGIIGNQLMGTMRRLGQQSAVRDPAQLSVLRCRLMQAGFYNREAPVIYLGIRAAALVAATVGVLLMLPLILGGKAGMAAILIPAAPAGAAILGPDQVLKARRVKREREYSAGV